MDVNVNHPSFISFLENITNNILTSIDVKNYFSLSSENKYMISFTVLNLIKNSSKLKSNISKTELKSFIVVLWKRNEELENYEFAEILNDVINSFDRIIELSESVKPITKRNKKKET